MALDKQGSMRRTRPGVVRVRVSSVELSAVPNREISMLLRNSGVKVIT